MDTHPEIRALRSFEVQNGRIVQKGEIVRLHFAAARARVNVLDAEWVKPEAIAPRKAAPPEAPKVEVRPEPPPPPRKPPKAKPTQPPQKKVLTPPETKDVEQCLGRTNKGTRCKRTGNLNEQGYCPLHRKQGE